MGDIALPKPHPAQKQVLDNCKRFNVLACGRRWGKTKLGCSLALEPAIAGLPVGWFAPTYKYLDDAIGQILARLQDVGNWSRYRSQDKRLELGSGGVVEFWSTEPHQAGDDESIVARGRKYARVVYDEAAHARRLKADWTKAIRPTLTDYKGDAWFLSTPHGQDYFHQLYLRGQHGEDGWVSWQLPTSTNPHIAPEEIEDARRQIPADAYEQEYEAKFLANAANPFGIDAIRACIQPISKGPVCHWGVDLAKSHDWTVAIGLNAMGEVCAFQRWQKDWRATGAALKAMLRDAPSLVDSTGVGDPIVEELQSVCGNVEGFGFTRQSKQRIMEGLAYAIQNKTIRFPAGVIADELETFQYEYLPAGVRYTAPDGLHDDCVCALALAVQCRAAVQPVEARILGDDTRVPEDSWDDVNDDALWTVREF